MEGTMAEERGRAAAKALTAAAAAAAAAGADGGEGRAAAEGTPTGEAPSSATIADLYGSGYRPAGGSLDRSAAREVHAGLRLDANDPTQQARVQAHAVYLANPSVRACISERVRLSSDVAATEASGSGEEDVECAA